MIILCLLGILATILVVPLIQARRAAVVSASQADIQQISTALAVYYATFQIYPTAGPVDRNLLGPSYLTTVPGTPGTPNGYYQFAPTQDNLWYTIVDPGIYDTDSLSRFIKASGPPSGGNVALTMGLCGLQGNCMHIGFSSKVGFFAY